MRVSVSGDGAYVLSFVAERPILCGGRHFGRVPIRGAFFSKSDLAFLSFTGVLEPPDSASGTVSDNFGCEETVPWSATVE